MLKKKTVLEEDLSAHFVEKNGIKFIMRYFSICFIVLTRNLKLEKNDPVKIKSVSGIITACLTTINHVFSLQCVVKQQ